MLKTMFIRFGASMHSRYTMKPMWGRQLSLARPEYFFRIMLLSRAIRLETEWISNSFLSIWMLFMHWKNVMPVKLKSVADWRQSIFHRFKDFTRKLRGNPLLDFLMLGQHMHEVCPGKYSFQLYRGGKERTGTYQVRRSHYARQWEWPLRCHCSSGPHFQAQNRLVRRNVSTKQRAYRNRVLAPPKAGKNLESMCSRQNYREEYCTLVPNTTDIVTGTDAHSIMDLVEKWNIQQLYYAVSWRRHSVKDV